MRVLVLTHCWPTEAEPHSGVFLKTWLAGQPRDNEYIVKKIGKYGLLDGLRAVRQYKPDLIIAHWLFPAGVVALLSCVPYVVYCHGTDVMMMTRSMFWRKMGRLVVDNSFGTLCVSEWLKWEMGSGGDWAFGVGVEPMPVNKDVFYPKETQKADPPLILYVANFTKQKRHKMLIDVLSVLGGTWQAEFIGGGSPSDLGLYDYAQKMRVSHRIKWTEPMEQRRLADKYRQAAVVVHCGLNEGYGMSVAEARACGTRVIVANSGGLPEAAGNNVWLFDNVGGLNTLLDIALNDRKVVAA